MAWFSGLDAGETPAEAPDEAGAGLLRRIVGGLCRGARVFGFAAWAQAAGWPGAGRLCAQWSTRRRAACGCSRWREWGTEEQTCYSQTTGGHPFGVATAGVT